MDLATKLMILFAALLVVFTAVLAFVTIWNVKVTKKLLKLSEEAFKQSRIAFLVSVVDGLTEYVNQSITKIGMDAIVSHCTGKLVAIGKIDKKVSEEIWQAMRDWGSDTKYKEFADKYEELYRKKLS